MKTQFKLKSIMLLASIMTLQVSVVSADNDGDFYYPYDGKVYHSSECSGYGDKPGGSFTRYQSLIKNRTSGFISIVCPIVRNKIALDTPDFSSTALEVIANVNNVDGKKYTCTLYKYDANARFLASDNQYITHNSTGAEKMTLKLDRNTQKYAGSYNLTCKIPPGGSFHDYMVKEYL